MECPFFKDSFIKRAKAVKFEPHDGTTYSQYRQGTVMYKLQRCSFNNECTFDKRTNKFQIPHTHKNSMKKIGIVKHI